MDGFNKVVGYENVVIELRRIIDMMNNMDKYKALGVKMTKGVLLHGEPGVGKTLMAKCFIKESSRKCFTLRKDMPEGDFTKYIKSVFNKAKKEAPSIVFLDDMDKFANEDYRHRNAEEYVTIQSCIDECKDDDVFVLATTNNLDTIPESLIREGRFDKTIVIDNPKREDAEKIIKHYLKNKRCAKDVDNKEIARLLNGRSCAVLETVINEAGVYTGYENREEISMDDLVRAFMRVVYKAPEDLSCKDDKNLLSKAYHEAGHAVVSEVLKDGSIPFISIKAYDGNVGGFVHIDRSDDSFGDIESMEGEVISLLAGKAASEVVFGTVDVGCEPDIDQAHKIVSRMVGKLCSLNFMNYEQNYEDPESMRHCRNIIVGYELQRYYRCAKKILIQNRDYLDRLAYNLYDRKVLLSKDVQALKEGA